MHYPIRHSFPLNAKLYLRICSGRKPAAISSVSYCFSCIWRWAFATVSSSGSASSEGLFPLSKELNVWSATLFMNMFIFRTLLLRRARIFSEKPLPETPLYCLHFCRKTAYVCPLPGKALRALMHSTIQHRRCPPHSAPH